MSTRVEFHILQSFAPSNLNRDDTGSPKDAVFGGTRRGRISSQSLKRAKRVFMRNEGLVPESASSYRTKRVHQILGRKLVDRGADKATAQQVAELALTGIGSGKGIRFVKDKTQYLIFLGETELNAIADLVAPHAEELAKPKAKVAKALADQLTDVLKLRGAGAVDIALFGRMLADLPEANTDASCQVAHAISTHRVEREFDYYTAVDDLQPEDNSGADMIGTIEFNSSCYYRYSVVDVDQLALNLKGEREQALDATVAYARAAIESAPTGKQNSFAAHNPPSTVLVLLRKSRGPRNLANAFEVPVASSGNGLITASAERLAKSWKQTDEAYGAAEQAWVLDLTDAFADVDGVQRVRSLDELMDALRTAVV
jgi:CRISPR system Cascade subunit CasC